ncbi:MAG TPA: ThuA domain-containing protein [bacterium]|nr:ThuA domain-containing protein [bacterium]HPN42305.1 ThuA domain-containing protein [bacterium]
MMKKILSACCAIFISLFVAGCQHTTDKLDIYLVTGGHDFERELFFAMFDSYHNLDYTEISHPGANDYYTPEKAGLVDVFVFYDMAQEISSEQKTALFNLLAQGKGLVFLHHSLAAYQNWDDFEKIIGGHYHEQPFSRDGQQFPASTYKHDVEMDLHISNANHPVTAGLTDFNLIDEVYGGFSVLSGITPLLTTTHPECGNPVAWAHTCGKSRIVYILPGHDHVAYADDNYRRLVWQAICWAANK